MKAARSIVLCVAVLAGSSAYGQFPAGFTRETVASTLTNPTAFAFAPDGRIFVTEQAGKLRVIKDGTLLATPFIDLTAAINSKDERGLLGVAFDPDFTNNSFIYLYYTVKGVTNPDVDPHNRVSRFTASGDVVLANSELAILDMESLVAQNHNGGALAFGPDGRLYVAVGENGTSANAQNLDTYKGKTLRINSDGSAPANNPFPTGSEARKRIWTYGHRNPYSFSFDPGTGRFLVNDVGQVLWEEIDDCTTGGGNYGWPTIDGIPATHNPLYVDPIFVYGHGTGDGIGCAITGGTFFHPTSTTYPSIYYGKYFFLDFCGAWINYIDPQNPVRSSFATSIGGSPVQLQMGADGNLYYLSRGDSKLYRIAYEEPTPPFITQQPTGGNIATGDSFEFEVETIGTGPLEYQWKLNDVDITDATSKNYTINSVTPLQSGDYKVTVTNAITSVTSDAASLSVAPPDPPTIVQQPVQPDPAPTGTSVQLGVEASGYPPLNYQWQHDGHDIEGAVNNELNIDSAALGDAGVYHVIVTNYGGHVTSSDVTIDVLPPSPPSIVRQPDEIHTVPTGDAVHFEVEAAGYSPLTYQWQLDGIDVAGATATDFDIDSVTIAQAGIYRVNVSNPVGSIASADILLKVLPPPPTVTGISPNGGEPIFSVAPNPSSGQLTIYIRSLRAQPVRFDFSDVTNRKVECSDHNLIPGDNHIVISTKGMSDGLYVLSTLVDGRFMTTRVLVVSR